MNDVDIAFEAAAAETGAKSSLRLCVSSTKTRHRNWTKDEDDFLRIQLGHLSEEEIARVLQRSVHAVHIRWARQLHLPTPSKHEDIITAEHIAIGLGMDSKSIHRLIDRGILPGRRLPSERVIRIVDRRVLAAWIMDPYHWLYIDPARVGALKPRGKRPISESYDFAFWEELSMLVSAVRQRWSDEWLTPGQVAKLLDLPSFKYVNHAIRRGKLAAKRWGNWRILKSSLPAGVTLNYRGEWVQRKEENND